MYFPPGLKPMGCFAVLSLNEQFQAFLVTVGIGLVMGICFDFYRVLRGLARPKGFLNHLGDLTLWIAVTIVVFALLLFGNWGEVRFYVFVGILLGLAIYWRIAGNRVARWIHRFLAFLTWLVRWLIRLVIWPFRMIYKAVLIPLGLLVKVLELLWRPIRRLARWIRKKAGSLGRRITLLIRSRRGPPPPPADI